MKKKLSVLGILFMLIFKYPPLPRLRLFHNIEIVQSVRRSIKELALQHHPN